MGGHYLKTRIIKKMFKVVVEVSYIFFFCPFFLKFLGFLPAVIENGDQMRMLKTWGESLNNNKVNK